MPSGAALGTRRAWTSTRPGSPLPRRPRRPRSRERRESLDRRRVLAERHLRRPPGRLHVPGDLVDHAAQRLGIAPARRQERVHGLASDVDAGAAWEVLPDALRPALALLDRTSEAV